MRLLATKDIGIIHKKKGEIFELPDAYAKTYILLGYAEKAKREYKRRDMTAENSREMTAEDS